MPSFNGYSLGPVTHFLPAENPVDWQQSTYAAVNGLQMGFLGARGSTVSCSGDLIAADVAGLAALRNTFMLMQRNGVGGILDMDDEGAYAGALLMEFHTSGEIVSAPGVGQSQSFVARFLFPQGMQ